MIKRIVLALSLLISCLKPAAAQFSDQATFAGTGAGSGNAQTIVVPNASSMSDLVGVLVKYIPSATNTSSATVTVNAFTACTFRKPTSAGLAALNGSPAEIVTGQSLVFMYDGSFCVIVSAVNDTPLAIGAANLANSSLQFGVPVNLQINASVDGSNNLIIAVKGNNASDPSPTNPILVPFRDFTVANGVPKIVPIQSALGFQINSGNTMGCVSGQICRLWVVVICSTGLECTDSAGSDVVGLCAFNANDGSGSVAAINEAALQTSQSGTSGGNSAQAYYCNISGVTTRAVRTLGYIDITEASAGIWATNPTTVQLFGPGIIPPASGPQIMQVQEQETSGTSSSNAPTSGAYRTVVVNTVVSNTITGASLTSNVVTLPSGTYTVEAWMEIGGGGNPFPSRSYRLQLYNTTDSAVLVEGINSAGGGDAAGNNSFGLPASLKGTFTIGASKGVSLQIRTAESISAATGASFGNTEVYVNIVFSKVI